MFWRKKRERRNSMRCSDQKIQGGQIVIDCDLTLYYRCWFEDVEIVIHPDVVDVIFVDSVFSNCRIAAPRSLLRKAFRNCLSIEDKDGNVLRSVVGG